jgi:hypothetical protein
MEGMNGYMYGQSLIGIARFSGVSADTGMARMFIENFDGREKADLSNDLALALSKAHTSRQLFLYDKLGTLQATLCSLINPRAAHPHKSSLHYRRMVESIVKKMFDEIQEM